MHHPKYQTSVASHVEVEISVAPRSDVVVTLYGNNMLYEPAHVIFSANGALKQRVKVTSNIFYFVLQLIIFSLGYPSFRFFLRY